MIKKLLIFFLTSIALIYFIFPFVFKSIYITKLKSESQIYESSLGPIEYKIRGNNGPVVLIAHGTPGGHDQTIGHTSGYRVLTPSRPGYLRTPLSVGYTPLEQAAAFKELLDGLGIEKVIVIGISGGGPSSMEFAADFPERTLGLIALEAVVFLKT